MIDWWEFLMTVLKLLIMVQYYFSKFSSNLRNSFHLEKVQREWYMRKHQALHFHASFRSKVRLEIVLDSHSGRDVDSQSFRRTSDFGSVIGGHDVRHDGFFTFSHKQTDNRTQQFSLKSKHSVRWGRTGEEDQADGRKQNLDLLIAGLQRSDSFWRLEE